MARIITQLSHLVLAARYQVVKIEQYAGESKEWLAVYDWNAVRRKLKFIIRNLLDLRYRLKLTYPEGDLIRVAKLFWLRNNYDMPVTEMNHRIDQVSEKTIKEYVNDGYLVDIDSDDVLGNISTLQIKGEWSTVQHVTILTLMVTTGD